MTIGEEFKENLLKIPEKWILIYIYAFLKITKRGSKLKCTKFPINIVLNNYKYLTTLRLSLGRQYTLITDSNK